MGGDGSGGARQGAGRKSQVVMVAKSLGRSQPSVAQLFAPQPNVAATTEVHQSEEQLQQQRQQRQDAIAEEQQRRRQEAIAMLQKVMDDGNLVQGLDQLLPEEDDDEMPEDDDDDEDDEDDEDDNDYQQDDITKKRKSAEYKPPEDTPLEVYLKGVKDEIVYGTSELRDRIVSEGLHWIPPPMDPVVCGTLSNPEPWYLADVWSFFWDPFIQHKLHLQSCSCHHCSTNALESHCYDWRPFFYFDKVIWVIHRRIVCKKKKGGCGKTFAAFDPAFMSANVPSPIAATFPFVATRRGPGMHEMMLFAFVELITKRIQFGIFASVFNSLYKIKYDKDRVSYYRSFVNKRERVEAIGSSISVPIPFGRFETVGEYNGMLLSSGLLKRLFVSFMQTHEKYFQASFQTRYDEGNTADHTHKYAKVIKASGRKGHIFTASYTVASLVGYINLARLTFTKSMQELHRIMKGYKEARANAQAPKLKRFESDNLNCDGGLWMKYFQEELSDGVIKPTTVTIVDNDLPFADIEPGSYSVITNSTQANIWARAACRIVDSISQDEAVYVGLDTENNWSRDGSVDSSVTHLLQICMPNHQVAVFHLAAMGVDSDETFPSRLKDFLQHPRLVACGVQIGGDLSRLRRLGVEIKRRIELRQLAIRHDANQEGGTGMQALCRRYLRKNVDKSGQSDANDYSLTPLPSQLAKYGALDALLSLKLVQTLMPMVSSRRDGQNVVVAPDDIKEGTEADLYLGGRKAARVVVTFVGTQTGCESRTWGKLLAGKGKALVQVKKVFIRNAKLPYLFQSSQESWPPGVDLGTICGNNVEANTTIMVNTSSIHVAIGTKNSNETPAPMTVEEAGPAPPSVEDIEGPATSAVDDIEEMFDIAEDQDHSIDEESNDNENESNPTRQKEDIWHEFKVLPLPKTCPLRGPLMQLLILATFCFEQEGYEATKKVVMRKEGITEESVLQHFIHNKEYWRKRVRMPVYPYNEHENNIRKLENFCKTNEFAKKYCTQELEQYFHTFRTKILEGKFTELHDVSIFRHDGVDRDGLDLWIRLRGSVRDENIHQKMRNCMGPWAVGAELAHYILVLLCYRYNVSTGIRRGGDIDFGHTFLFLIDEIQSLIQDIYNVVVYPRHLNVSCYKSVDLVSVGIGPLTQSDAYVDAGEPMEHLRGDMRHLARRMRLKCPPLESKSKEEFEIENKFFLANPNATMTNFAALAKEFKDKYDGVRIFPKLPTQVQASFKRWKVTHFIKKFLRDTKEDYNAILDDLVKTKVDGSSIKTNERRNCIEAPPSLTAPQYVPPISAPLQKEPIGTLNRLSTDHLQTRWCAWFPLCQRMAEKCNGYRREMCMDAGKRFKTPETTDELKAFEVLARAEKTKDRARRAAEKRKAEKEKREEHSKRPKAQANPRQRN